MLSDYLCPTNNVYLRSPSSRFFDDTTRMQSLRLLQSLIVVTNDTVETTVSSAPHTFPALSALAANACANRMIEVGAFSLPDNIQRVARFMGDNSKLPFVVQQALRETLYQCWKSLSIGEHTWLAEAVAIERVLAGHSCKTVAQAHGISRESALMRQLNMLAVDGPAGARAFAGECCYTVAEAHGIEMDSVAFNWLQKHAVMGRAGERVRNGEPCIQVAEDHGICLLYEAMDMLEMVAVSTCAGERVRKGESCQLVAREHGINPMFSAMCELENIAVKTVAGARVRQGELCYVVAWDHGISHCHSAMHNLEMVAVEAFGAERVKNGECCALVALSLGIALDGEAVKVLADLEMTSDCAAMRPRLQ